VKADLEAKLALAKAEEAADDERVKMEKEE
jgi:hypothetical protein